MRALTKGQAAILARMRELATGDWEPVPSHSPTIRLTRTVDTPEYARGTGFGRWDQPTYEEHLFVTLAGGKVILGHAPCPWVGRSDSEEPLWYASELLNHENPWAVLEDRLALKAQRKARRAAGEQS